MNFSFGNMTLKLNVLNMCRQPNEENENEDEIDEQKELLESCIDENIQKGNFLNLVIFVWLIRLNQINNLNMILLI